MWAIWGQRAAWFRLAALAHHVLTAMKCLALPPELLRARPKPLRFLVFQTPGRLIRHARTVVLRIVRTWSQFSNWRHALVPLSLPSTARRHVDPGPDACAGQTAESRPRLLRRGKSEGRVVGARPHPADPVRRSQLSGQGPPPKRHQAPLFRQHALDTAGSRRPPIPKPRPNAVRRILGQGLARRQAATPRSFRFHWPGRLTGRDQHRYRSGGLKLRAATCGETQSPATR